MARRRRFADHADASPKSWQRSTRTAGRCLATSGHASSRRPNTRSASSPTALFLAEDAGILRILADKGRVGVSVRIALGAPDSPHVAERSAEEGIGDAMPAKVRNALTLYHPLREVPNIEIRLHRTTLYNSIYRADDQLLVNQHAYGVHASHAPVFCLNGAEHGDMAATVRARHVSLPIPGSSRCFG